jgi:hypothetical protein
MRVFGTRRSIEKFPTARYSGAIAPSPNRSKRVYGLYWVRTP